MAKLEKKLNIPKSIEDLVDLDRTSASALFYRYKDKTGIGKEIFKELLRKFDVKANGFYMDDSGKDIGVLSQCQSLQSLLLLASSFGLEFDDENLEGTKHYVDAEGQKKPYTIRKLMDVVIEDIIKRLTVKDAETGREYYVFNASPYKTGEAFDEQYAYIDCVTWVIPTFLLVLRYHIDIGQICKFEKELIRIINRGLDYINEAYIHPDEKGRRDKLTCGWNFTKDCEEPSLYFTFAVEECYVDLYTAFEEYLGDREALRDSKDGISIDDEIVERIALEQEKFNKTLEEKSYSSIRYDGLDLAFFENDKYNEIKRVFMLINEDDEDFGSRYGELERKCKQVAGMVWPLVKSKFADYFFFNDLHATITEEDIKMSTTNDALFNTVYIINILIDAGFDEDINRRIAKARIVPENETEDEAAAREKEFSDATTEYNNLLDTCQFALQKAFRVYENLKNESREYIVDQFLIGFNEKLTKLETKVRELRKLRIRVFSLVPLFIKTNSVVSEYLVKYPQNSMKKYLGYILDNRYIEKSRGNVKTLWIWEKDGYFSASNYYYISALGEFYSYYETYEMDFIDDAIHAQQVRKQHEEEIGAREDAIQKLKAEIKAKEKAYDKLEARTSAEITSLRTELDNYDTPVEDAVQAVIRREIKNLLGGALCELFNDAALALTQKYTIEKKPDQVYVDLKASIGRLIISFMAETIMHNCDTYKYPPAENDSRDNHTEEEIYARLVRDITEDFEKIIDNHVHSISAVADSSNTKFSTLYKQVSSS